MHDKLLCVKIILIPPRIGSSMRKKKISLIPKLKEGIPPF